MNEYFLIITICLIIMMGPMLSKLINVPVVVVEISLGIFAGYFGLIYDAPILILLAKFGFVYLMFLVGLEVNFALIKVVKSTMAWNVVLYFVSLYSISGVLCWLFDLGITYFVALPIFSLGMLVMLIKEYGKEEPWLNLALSIGIVGEVVSILALTLFSGWIEYGGFKIEFLSSIFTIILVILGIVLVLRLFYLFFWWFPELKKIIIPDSHTDRFDQDIRFSISMLLFFVSIMLIFKIDVVLGAFAAGLFLKMFFHEKQVLIEKIESFGFGFFVPIFFIYTGSTVKLEIIDTQILLHSLFIIGSIVFIRLISSYLAFYKYLKFKQTALFALSDSMPLTFLVAISMLAFKYEIITQEVYFSFIIASILDGLFLMVVIRKLYRLFGMQQKN